MTEHLSACTHISESRSVTVHRCGWCVCVCVCTHALPDPGIKSPTPVSPLLAGKFFTTNTIWEAPVDGYLTVKSSRKIFEAVKISYITVLVVISVYIPVEICQYVHLKLVHFIVLKLYLIQLILIKLIL